MELDNLQENAIATGSAAPEAAPPVAQRRPVESRLHGDLRVDDYGWLREKENPEVLRYLEGENAYTDALLQPTATFQEALYQEMLARIQQTDLTVPYRLRGFLYWTKTVEGRQYPLRWRRPADGKDSDGELLLDLNALAEGHSFLGLGSFEISDHNQFLAYSTDTSGFRQYTLAVKDLRTGDLLPFRAERVTSVAWSADNRHLFYVVEDPVTKRSHRLYRHSFGDPASTTDTLLYEEPDQRFRIDVERARSGAYLFLVINSHTTSEVRFLYAATPEGEFQPIAQREDN